MGVIAMKGPMPEQLRRMGPELLTIRVFCTCQSSSPHARGDSAKARRGDFRGQQIGQLVGLHPVRVGGRIVAIYESHVLCKYAKPIVEPAHTQGGGGEGAWQNGGAMSEGPAYSSAFWYCLP